MKPKRKQIGQREVIDTLLAQGVKIMCPCPWCTASERLGLPGKRIIRGSDAIREHVHQLGTGGKDNPANWQYWHIEDSNRKTNGTKATSAGSDAHARAKIRRQTGQNKPKRKRKIPSRPFAKRKKP